MTSRELFNAIMHYEDFDRMPVWHWTGWEETLERWHAEGLPEGANEQEFFNASVLNKGFPINLDLFPAFEERTLEETDEYRIHQQDDGVIAQSWKNRSSIPHYIDYVLKDSSTWDEYKKRLQPDPGRLPKDFDALVAKLNAGPDPVAIDTRSIIGVLRNWMGVENLAMATMCEPDFVAEYVEVMSDLVCWGIDQVAPHVKIDMGWGWEDICFKTGPLIHPDAFKQLCVPGYRKIADKLRSYGCDLYVVDCDGFIDHLIPHWLEAGVNVMFPVEIGTWNADPMAMRKQFGKELRIIGGINKLVLEGSHAEIDAEIARRIPIMAEGGFIPLPDHVITPGVSLENMQYYIDAIRALRF